MTKNSVNQAVVTDMKEFTHEKSHINVNIVTKNLLNHDQAVATRMTEFINKTLMTYESSLILSINSVVPKKM